MPVELPASAGLQVRPRSGWATSSVGSKRLATSIAVEPLLIPLSANLPRHARLLYPALRIARRRDDRFAAGVRPETVLSGSLAAQAF